MNRPSVLVQTLCVSLVAASLSLGCNAVLSNEEGTRRADGGPVIAADGGDGGGNEIACDTARGNKVCFGLCVKINEPSTGCGVPSACAACDPKNAVNTKCVGGTDTYTCGYDACQPGFGSCDSNVTNGCETSLSTRNNCGTCSKQCKSPLPFCAPVASNRFDCAAVCPAGSTECSGSCVDIKTSLANCGGCGRTCERPGAQATCENGNCKLACNSGTHFCPGPAGPICASNIDTAFCGASCTVCAAPGPNQTVSCTVGMCTLKCAAGYSDCDGKASNGCETPASFCPLSFCGGKLCNASEQCCNGNCTSSMLPCASGN